MNLSLTMLVAIGSAIFSLSASADAREPEKPPLRVELVVAGDDGLTRGFANEIELALSKSSDILYPAKSTYDVRLYLAGNLYWKDTARGTNFNVVVIVTDQKQRFLGVSNGACWEHDMKECAEEVVSETLVFAKKK